MSQNPYLTKVETIVHERVYNPDYGDERICKCGHHYYRHFDSYEENVACGCKYCRCFTFEEAAFQKEEVSLTAENVEMTNHIGLCRVNGNIIGVILPVEIIDDLSRSLHFFKEELEKDPKRYGLTERIRCLSAICDDTTKALEDHWKTK